MLLYRSAEARNTVAWHQEDKRLPQLGRVRVPPYGQSLVRILRGPTKSEAPAVVSVSRSYISNFRSL